MAVPDRRVYRWDHLVVPERAGLDLEDDDLAAAAAVGGADPVDGSRPGVAAEERPRAGVRLDRPQDRVEGDPGHAAVVVGPSGEAHHGRAMRDTRPVRHVGAAVVGVVRAVEVQPGGEILVTGAIPPVDVGDDDATAGRTSPRLVDPASEDVPLVLEAGGRVHDHLVAGAHEWLVEWRLRRDRPRDRDGPLHLRKAFQVAGDLHRVGVRWEVQRDEALQAGDVGRLRLGGRAGVRSRRALERRLGLLEPILLQHAVQLGEVGVSLAA